MAAARYREARAKEPINPVFSAGWLQRSAKYVSSRGDAKAALLLLQVNAAAAPDSARASADLADGCARSGDKAGAVTAYRRALAVVDQDKGVAPAAKEELRKDVITKLEALGAEP